jgi:Undecaprenyl-phosphate galactose phosphotransferase WbaP
MGTTLEACFSRKLTATIPVVRVANPVATGAALMAADALAVVASFWLGVALWTRVNQAVTVELYLPLWPEALVFLAAYATHGLYPGVGISPVEELRRTVLGTSVVYLVATASVFLSKDAGRYSRGVFLTCWAFTAVLVPLVRSALRRAAASQPWWGVPVLVLGAGSSGRMVVENLTAQLGFGLKPVAFLDDNAAKDPDADGVPFLGPLSLAADLSRRFRIRHAVVAMPGVKRKELLAVLERAGAIFNHVIVIPDLLGISSLWVSVKDLGGLLGLEIKQNLLSPVNRCLKRGLDLALALTAGVLALPVLAVAVLWIKRVSPGPALYLQLRGGEGGKTIRVLKLRTMFPDAGALLEDHLREHPEARPEWERYFKLKRDPRLLPVVGPLLRRTSLDELPQLWNVLRGEMSLVGPRPFPSYHLEQFDPEFRTMRARVLPGLTGLWQVSARSDGDLKVQQTLDTYYIRNWSLWLDIHILARTVRAVLLRQGAY